MSEPISIADQIAEAERQRVKVNYLDEFEVQRKKMTQAEFETHTARMDAAVKTLRWLERNAVAIRLFMEQRGGSDV